MEYSAGRKRPSNGCQPGNAAVSAAAASGTQGSRPLQAVAAVEPAIG